MEQNKDVQTVAIFTCQQPTTVEEGMGSEGANGEYSCKAVCSSSDYGNTAKTTSLHITVHNTLHCDCY